MSLKDWENNGWLRRHQSSKQEINDLLNIVERDIHDAQRKDVSSDWRFGIAYNGALKLCTILLYLEGYRPEKNLAHYRTIQALGKILGDDYNNDVDYLDTCRNKRNIIEYDYVGAASENEAIELIDFVKDLKEKVLSWIKAFHPEFI